MANDLTKDPIVLDTTMASAETTAHLRIQSVEWVKPTAADHLATLLDADGNTIVEFKCVTANLNMVKYFNPPKPFRGLNMTALSSGKLLVSRV